MAEKRLPSNNGERDFEFLSSGGDADVTDAGDAGLRGEPHRMSIVPVTIEDSSGDPSAEAMVPLESDVAPLASPAGGGCQASGTTSAPNIAVNLVPATDHVSRKLFVGVTGYAIALTLLCLGLFLTGRMSLFGNHALESLPDLRPLAPNEFRKVPDRADLPDGHVMRLGESRRFGDVVVTPVRLTREPLQFQGFLSGAIEEKLTTAPVLKLWLTFQNVAVDYEFPPFDAGLMSNRTPADAQDAATLVNTFLTIGIPSGDSATTRRLNFLHSMDNNFVIVGQESAKVLQPGESLTTFVAESDEEGDVHAEDSTPCVWRVQFRKGVNMFSGHGVTTLIDIKFSGADVAASG